MDSSCREAEATSSLRHSGSGRPVSPPLLKRQGGRPSASILTTPPPSPLEGRPSVALEGVGIPTPSQTAMHCLWPPCRDPPHPPPRGGLRQPPHVFSPIPPPPRGGLRPHSPPLSKLPGTRPSAAPHVFSPPHCQGGGLRPPPTCSHHSRPPPLEERPSATLPHLF